MTAPPPPLARVRSPPPLALPLVMPAQGCPTTPWSALEWTPMERLSLRPRDCACSALAVAVAAPLPREKLEPKMAMEASSSQSSTSHLQLHLPSPAPNRLPTPHHSCSPKRPCERGRQPASKKTTLKIKIKIASKKIVFGRPERRTERSTFVFGRPRRRTERSTFPPNVCRTGRSTYPSTYAGRFPCFYH